MATSLAQNRVLSQNAVLTNSGLLQNDVLVKYDVDHDRDDGRFGARSSVAVVAPTAWRAQAPAQPGGGGHGRAAGPGEGGRGGAHDAPGRGSARGLGLVSLRVRRQQGGAGPAGAGPDLR